MDFEIVKRVQLPKRDPFFLVNIEDKQVEIDEKVFEHVVAFNKLGLKTHMSCQGHDYTWPRFTIWFDPNVTDEQVKNVYRKIYSEYRKEFDEKRCSPLYGNFVKSFSMMKKKNDEIVEREQWIYYTVGRNSREAIRLAHFDLKHIQKVLENEQSERNDLFGAHK